MNPFEVEHNLNPVIFPAPSTTKIHPQRAATDDQIATVSSISPDEPIEMEAEESQFDALNGSLVMAIDGIPHQWEQTLGSDRRFFEMEREMLEKRRQRRREDEIVSQDLPRRKGKARQEYAEPSESCKIDISTTIEDMYYETGSLRALKSDDKRETLSPVAAKTRSDSHILYVYLSVHPDEQ